jgi:hypothetical protein
VDLIWRRGSKGLPRSRFVALRVRPAGVTPRRQAAKATDRELPVRWLLAEWPTGTAEPVKYWLSSLPADTPPLALVRLGELRWRIEQDDRELKGALGLDHYEGRSWPGWRHHVTLVSVAPRLPHPGAAGPPETGGVGLTCGIAGGAANSARLLGRRLPYLRASHTPLVTSTRTTSRPNLTEPY